MFTDNRDHYLLLTPGPLSTTSTVKEVMLNDWCTWDADYNGLVQQIRSRLVHLATKSVSEYTAVLMQGSGTFGVEGVIGTVIPKNGKLLVIVNGAYGRRMVEIARRLGIPVISLEYDEFEYPDASELEECLASDESITHVAIVHCETTTGILNPLETISRVVSKHRRQLIVDAMSSFGGIEFDVAELSIDYLVSSANKCLQGVPGFCFVIARIDRLKGCRGQARSLSLDIYDQWDEMERNGGKWRYTSPTHVVRALYQALVELDHEGGVRKRYERYSHNHRTLVAGMRQLGFQTFLPSDKQSPIVTSFLYPDNPIFNFHELYRRLKEDGFIIYPGKVTSADTFRIGHIGNVTSADILNLVQSIKRHQFWK